MSDATSRDHDVVTHALVAAAGAAVAAPSIHNTQPWRWSIHDGVADLYANAERHLTASDPQRRLLMVSCGASLHRACVALAAEGFDAEVTLMPDEADADHLATVLVTGRVPVTADALRMAQAIGNRHTDRRPLADESLSPTVMAAARSAAETYGVNVDVLDRDRVLELAAAIDRAQRALLSDVETRAELTEWTSRGDRAAAGVPAAVIPDEPPRTTVPGRDFGHFGSMPITDKHDGLATYAILSGSDDDPRAWLRAGEALSAMWLVATDWSVALLPLSAAIEMLPARQLLRDILAGVSYPYIAVRLGVPDPASAPIIRTSRLPMSETVQVDEE